MLMPIRWQEFGKLKMGDSGYTQREPNKKPLRPINRLPRTDRYKKTAYNRLF